MLSCSAPTPNTNVPAVVRFVPMLGCPQPTTKQTRFRKSQAVLGGVKVSATGAGTHLRDICRFRVIPTRWVPTRWEGVREGRAAYCCTIPRAMCCGARSEQASGAIVGGALGDLRGKVRPHKKHYQGGLGIFKLPHGFY